MEDLDDVGGSGVDVLELGLRPCGLGNDERNAEDVSDGRHVHLYRCDSNVAVPVGGGACDAKETWNDVEQVAEERR